MTDYSAMAVFVEVVQAGSFAGAARQLSMPLSTVSRKISTLEADLQVRLLERSKKRLLLTEAGALYFDHCRRGVEAFSAANRALEERQTKASGLLRITVPPNLVEHLLLPVIDAFRMDHPNAHVAVHVSERMVDLRADPFDLSFRVGPVADPDLVVRKLASYRHVLVAAPAYLSNRPAPQHPTDLVEHDLLAFGFGGSGAMSWSLRRRGKQERVVFQPAIAINDYAALAEAVSLGLGIGELPPILCREALRRRTLIAPLDDWLFPDVDLLAVHTGTLSRLARLFLDRCVAQFQSLGPDFMGLGSGPMWPFARR